MYSHNTEEQPDSPPIQEFNFEEFSSMIYGYFAICNLHPLMGVGVLDKLKLDLLDSMEGPCECNCEETED